MSMYSVPSFGGHIAISRDVTRYPILVIRRTEKLCKTFSETKNTPAEEFTNICTEYRLS